MRGKKCIRLQCRGGQGLRVKEGSIWRKELTEKKESTIKFFEQLEVWTFLNIRKNVDFFDDTHASDDEQYQEAHNYSSTPLKIAGLLKVLKNAIAWYTSTYKSVDNSSIVSLLSRTLLYVSLLCQ